MKFKDIEFRLFITLKVFPKCISIYSLFDLVHQDSQFIHSLIFNQVSPNLLHYFLSLILRASKSNKESEAKSTVQLWQLMMTSTLDLVLHYKTNMIDQPNLQER